MLNNAINHNNKTQTNIDIKLFTDNGFSYELLTSQEENSYITIQTIELAEAKALFQELSKTHKVSALRYMLSRRIFETRLLPIDDKDVIRSDYALSYGSLCAMTDSGTETISLESQLITRILYIAESMTLKEFHQISHELIRINSEYHVLMKVIKTRLNFHLMTE